MKPLAISILLVSMPFAAKGFITIDWAAWGTAFLALIMGFGFMAFEAHINNQN